MTQAEIEAQWQRYMHRSDLAADMTVTFGYAKATIRNRLMRKPADPLLPDAEVDALLISNPQLYLHAGLMYLAELAMDDAQLARESGFFDASMNDYQMRYSIEFVDPRPVLYGGNLEP